MGEANTAALSTKYLAFTEGAVRPTIRLSYRVPLVFSQMLSQ